MPQGKSKSAKKKDDSGLEQAAKSIYSAVRNVNRVGAEVVGVGPIARAITGTSEGQFGKGQNLSGGQRMKELAIGAVNALAAPLVQSGVKAALSKASNIVSNAAGELAFRAASEGIENASRGGRVFRTTTPFGPTLASTKVMSTAERSARINNLLKRSENIANTTEASLRSGLRNVAADIAAKAGGVTRTATGSAALARGVSAAATPNNNVAAPNPRSLMPSLQPQKTKTTSTKRSSWLSQASSPTPYNPTKKK
jgi:hypothetical protein